MFVKKEDIKNEIMAINLISKKGMTELLGYVAKRNKDSISLFDFTAYKSGSTPICLEVKTYTPHPDNKTHYYMSVEKYAHIEKCPNTHFMVYYFKGHNQIRVFSVVCENLEPYDFEFTHKVSLIHKIQKVYRVPKDSYKYKFDL